MEAIKYTNYQDLIHSLAWSWANTTGLEQEELFSEGNLVFCKILNKYDKPISEFSTYLVNCINRRFGNILKSRRRRLRAVGYVHKGDNKLTPEKSAEFWSNIHSLSPEAQDVIDIIISGPSEIAQMGNLYSHLREAGYAWRVIFNCVKEIKSIFN